MKTLTSIFALLLLTVAAIFLPGAAHSSVNATTPPANGPLVFADFEKVENNRPVSSRGGYVQIFGGQENSGNPAKFTGMVGANNAPELVRIKPDDPNKAATFSYVLPAPNQYANVTLEIHGLPDKDGKTTGEDVSAYKNLTMQVYAKGTPAPTGVEYMRVEVTSHGQGINLQYGFPQSTFKLNPAGFNTYKIPLKSLAQPSWMDDRVDLKDVLKKLTSVQISVYCNQCAPITGVIVIDNITFTTD